MWSVIRTKGDGEDGDWYQTVAIKVYLPFNFAIVFSSFLSVSAM
jgi:hypothetical protein